MNLSAESAVDVEAVMRAHAQTGFQLASFAAPPTYIILALVRRRPIALNRVLRATWLSGTGGVAAGAGWGYYESTKGAEFLKSRHTQIAYDTNRIRADDYSTIGSVLGAVLTPALLWNRARAVHLLLGGAALGSSVGLGTHVWRLWSEPPAPLGPGPVVAKSGGPKGPTVARSSGGV